MRAFLAVLFGMFVAVFTGAAQTATLTNEPVMISDDRTFKDIALAMKPGDWVAIETIVDDGFFANDKKGNHNLSWSDSAKWDPNTKCIYHYGGGHLMIPAFTIYCTESNQWIRGKLPDWLDLSGSPWGYTNHGHDKNSIDPDKGILYFYRSRQLWSYSTLEKTWNKTKLKHGNKYLTDGSEFFPGIGVIIPVSESKSLYYVDHENIQHKIKGALNNHAQHSFAEYSYKKDILLYGGGDNSNEVFTLNRQFSSKRVADSPNPIRSISNGKQGAIVTVDPLSGNFLVLFTDNRLYEYDPDTDQWIYVDDSPFRHVPLRNIIGATIWDYEVVFYARALKKNKARVFLYKHKSSQKSP